MADEKENDGVWRTVCGRRIFIRKGQSLTDAMRESGKFKKSDIDSAKPASAKTAPKSETPKQYGGKSSKEFAIASKAVKTATAKESPHTAWRVTAHTQEELDRDYPGAKLHVTDGGSTSAVTKDGDIISICRKPGDSTNGKQIMAEAVKNGGTKLDSYSGNHGFYLKCGFEPVSWCDWDDEYAPDDWKTVNGFTDDSWKSKSDKTFAVKREPIIFYKYTGKVTTGTASQFMENVPASKSYDDARSARDKSMEDKK